MFSIFFLFCFLLVASSDSVVPAKKRDVAGVTDWLHKIHKRHSSHLGVRQSGIPCYRQLEMNLTSNCNLTALSGGVSNLPDSSLTDAQLTTLNNAYSQFCGRSACIDLYIAYYNCISTNENQRNYYTTYLRRGYCGQESGDYCLVRYIKQYQGSSDQNPFDSCHFNDTGISCSSASSTCLSDVNTFSDRMGCCTEPFLGSGVTSCSGVSVDEPCTGVSSATGLVAPVFVMILSLVGFLV
uniref:Uncharacterized protein n=1 Tax=Amphimedon queenslandica TaxID=400682 RepID=A0A1X7T8Y1_AMPQE